MILRLFFICCLAALQFPLLPQRCDALPPPPPRLLAGFPLIAGDNVVLAWTPVPGAVSYKVYRDGRYLGSVGASGYATPLPASAAEVRFQVSAVSQTGEESPLSAPGILRLRKIEPPTHIESSVDPDRPCVLIAWVDVPKAIGYNVYRAGDGGAPALLHSGSAPCFWDRSVRKGSRYRYAVTAIDRSGREGEKSPWHAVAIPAEPQARKAPGRKAAAGAGGTKGSEKEKSRPSRFDAAFQEVMSIAKINNVPLGEVSFLGPGNDNVFWVVRPAVREIHAVNRAGEAVMTLGPRTLDSAAKGFVPHKMAVAADGRMVISDARNGAVACFDAQGDLLWSRKIDPPPDTEQQVWEGFPSNVRKLPASPSSVLILPGEILVSDQRFQLIYRLGPAGDFRGYITHYRKGEDRWRLRRIGELEAVPGQGILVTFPLVRRVLLVNGDFVVASEIAGSRKDGSAGFLGLHGLRFVPGEGVLLTDPMTGRIKIYDPETGEHLRDLKTPAFPNPNMAAWDGGERLWVYLARQGRIAVLARGEAGK